MISPHPNIEVVRHLHRHGWAALPILPGGTGPVGPALITEGGADVDLVTLEHFGKVIDSSEAAAVRGVTDGGGLAWSPELRAAMQPLQERVNHLYSSLLLGAPPLDITYVDPTEALLGEPALSWTLRDASGDQVPLAASSSAQQRWAHFAIRLALAEAGDEDRSKQPAQILAIVDEPEQALHPAAQRHLARGLEELAERDGSQLLVASHSPVFLDPSRFRLHHLARDQDGLARLHSLPADLNDQVEQLGLHAADLLAQTRICIVVEGQHELAIFGAALGDELSRLGAILLPLRGLSRVASLLDAEMINRYTGAPILVVVDNDRDLQIETTWTAVRAAWRERGTDWARERVASLTGTSETRLVRDLLRDAIDRGDIDRLTVIGMRQPDILDYLPPDELLTTKGMTWEQLRNDPQAPDDGTRLKAWLRNHHGLQTTDDALRHATATLDHLPEDWTRLLTTAEGLVRPSIARS